MYLRSFPPLNACNSLLREKGPVFLTVHTFIHFPPNDSSFSTSGKEYPSKLKPAPLDPAVWVSSVIRFL